MKWLFWGLVTRLSQNYGISLVPVLGCWLLLKSLDERATLFPTLGDWCLIGEGGVV